MVENISSICPLDDGISSVTLVRVSGSDLDVVNAARVSYNKYKETFDDKDKKLIKFLIQNNPPHTSPFEHTQIVYKHKMPIFVVREFHRHRVGISHSEISQRFLELGKAFPLQFYIPKVWREQSKTNKQASEGTFENEEALIDYIKVLNLSVEVYDKLIASGIARELARCVLPLCTYTEMYSTFNLVSLFHFLKLRLHPAAQYEIQQYARAFMLLAEPFFPECFAAWKETVSHNSLINAVQS